MSYLLEDLRRYFGNQKTIYSKLRTVLLTQGIWAIIIYRAGSWCHNRKGKYPWVRVVLPFLTIFQKMVEITTGIVLPFTAEIGKGLYIGHFGGIILSPRAILGNYCNISQGITVGQAGRGGFQFTPVIGDRVYIGPGAKIFGGIRIGNDVAIGANAVVTKDLPDNAVAGGVPAKIINFGGSRDFVIIPEED
jgi:serine O-acetyltransferase